MMRGVYSTLLYLLLPLIFLRLLWRSWRAPAYRQRWHERLGFITPFPPTPRIWLHAVSVGEVQAALPLLRTLQQTYPHYSLLVTTMTPTGSAHLRAALPNVEHIYLPYDVPDAIARFLKRVQPSLGLIMETELWLNLLHACHQRQIPTFLLNARLSKRSARGYARVGHLTHQGLSYLTAVAAQGRADARRLQILAGKQLHLRRCGNLKFDLTLPVKLFEQGQALRQQWGAERLVWVAGSTRAGEEKMVLTVFQQLRQMYPNLLLILVPRHPERFKEVAQLCANQALPWVRRSHTELPSTQTAIYLGDTMGDLLRLYAAADVAFVGGSLMPLGGHNPLEPAALGLPVVFGSHTFNFSDICQQLVAQGAAQQVKDTTSLLQCMQTYFTDSALRQRDGARAQAFVQRNRGSLACVLDLITPYL